MNTAQQAGQSARDLAQKIAKQMAQEPLEVLKDAGSQVTGLESLVSRENSFQNSDSKDQVKILHHQNELQDKNKSSRRMEALNQELKDIHKQDLFKDLQRKISQGIEVPVADYTELSMEQRQVLNAQKEAVENQKREMVYKESQNKTPFLTSKPSRRFGAKHGQKAEAEKQQTRVEKPVPPSG